MRIFSTLSLMLFAFSLSFGGFSGAAAAKANPKYASIVIDGNTGRVLSQRYADKTLHPASLTKVMTLILAFEALDKGQLRMNDRIVISRRAADMVPSKLGLKAGSTIRVRDAIYSLITKSANDVAVALAEHIAGTESHFALRMTRRAHEIGMRRTFFKNASGLHHKRQVTTARDMAQMARYLIQNYPHYYGFFSTRHFTYRGETYRNHNKLMASYKGMDGIKTGYIQASGFNLIASAVRNNRRVIGVVFGGRTGKSRNAHMAALLNRGFSKLKDIRVAFGKPPLPARKPGAIVQLTSAQPLQTAQHAATPHAARNLSYASLASYTQEQKGKSLRLTVDKNEESAIKNITFSAAMESALDKSFFRELIGEGDYDPAASKRLETGLLAVAVHKGHYVPNPAQPGLLQHSYRQAGHAVIAKMSAAAQDNDNNNSDKKGKKSAPGFKKITLSQTSDLTLADIPRIQPAAAQIRKTGITSGKGSSPAEWAAQVGAYKSRAKTDSVLQQVIRTLPPVYASARPVIVPLNTKKGILFRARLTGLSKSAAEKICKTVKDCMTVPPSSL